MRPSGKWIEGICPEGSVEDAARRALDARLTAVVHWLPLAAYLAEQDVEHVHRLRVSTRRAMAALKLYRDWLRPKQFRGMKTRLKKIRGAAGDARDLDVLADRLARDYGERAAPVIALIAERRAAVQSAVIEMADRCRLEDRFIRKIGKLLAAIRPPRQHSAAPLSFRDWAAKQLINVSATFFAALSDNSADVAVLHQFRIRAKALRYTIELAAPAFGPELRSEYYPIVEELQERLGKIQDHVTAGARLSEWSDAAGVAAQREALREMAAAENARIADAIGEFREWWTTDRAAELWKGLRSAAKTDAATARPQDAHQT